MTDDPVTRPAHYTWIPGIECRDVAALFDFHRGSALKYIWRSGRKEGEPEERALEKAIEALQNRLRYLRHERSGGGVTVAEMRHREEDMP